MTDEVIHEIADPLPDSLIEETAPKSPVDSPSVQQRTATVLAAGWLLHWFSQTFNYLPVSLYLKNRLHMDPVAISLFTTYTLFAWNLKPIAGWMCDNIRIGGRRRKPYLLISATVGSLLWLLLYLLPSTFKVLLWSLVAINTSLMFTSTALGGLLVDSGKRNNTLGRLSAQRYAISNTVTLVGGPVGGFLASRMLSLTIGISAACLLALLPIFLLMLEEKPSAVHTDQTWDQFLWQLRTILRSRSLWWGLAMSWLLYFAPGFGTPLLFYQQGVLKLGAQFIGNLGFVYGAMGLVSAAIYFKLCRRLPLSRLLVVGIIVNVIGTLFYVWYRSPTAAVVITGIGGFVSTLALLPLWDLSGRATPTGFEALGYSLMMSVENLAMRFSDLSGSILYKHGWKFMHLVLLNAGATALIVLVIPLLPRSLVGKKDGE